MLSRLISENENYSDPKSGVQHIGNQLSLG